MSIRFRLNDDVLIRFEANVTRIGEGNARRAFARSMNHVGRRGFTALKRTLRRQTSIKAGTISRAMAFRPARVNSLSFTIEGSGNAIPLRDFGARQFGYGVRARVWGRSQRFAGAFIVESLGGNAFVRTSRARLPIRKMFGPSIPNEMLKDEAIEGFDDISATVIERATHEIAFLLGQL